MSLLAALILAAAPEPLLIAPYQSLGVEAPALTALQQALHTAAADEPSLVALPVTESDKYARSATMCGEDGACLATVGQRAGARWVLAFGVGKVGASLLISGVFVDVKQGKELMRGSRRVPETNPEWLSIARSLFTEVVKPPAEPVVVQVPIEVVKPQKQHKFRPWAFASLGLTVAFGLVSTIVGLVAWGNYARLQMATVAEYPDLYRNQKSLNASADLCLIGAGLAGIVSIIFFIFDVAEKPSVPES